MQQWIQRARNSGATLIEYGMLLGLVAIVATVVVKTSGSKTASTYNNIQSQLAAHGVGSTSPQAPNSAPLPSSGSTAAASGTSVPGSAVAAASSSASENNGRNNGRHRGQNQRRNNERD